MSANGQLNTDTDTEFPSWTELLVLDMRGEPYHVPTRRYQIVVFRGRDQIFKTNFIKWTENGLHKGIQKIRLHFKEIPAGIRFVVRVTSLQNKKGMQTDTDITSGVQESFSKSPKGYTLLPLGKSGLSLPKINASVRKSRWEALGAPPAKRKRSGTGQKSSPAFNRNFTRQRVRTYSVTSSTGNSSSSTAVNVQDQTVSSVRTPNFKALARTKKLPANPFSFKKRTLGTGTFSHTKDYYHVNGASAGYSYESWNISPLFALADINPDHLGIDENRLIAKLADRINAANANLLEDLSTANQTLRLFTNNVNRLRLGIKYIRTNNMVGFLRHHNAYLSRSRQETFSRLWKQSTRNGRRGSRLLADLWLEYRFGWLPLLNDIEAGIKLYAQYQARGGEVCTVKAKLSKTDDWQAPSGSGLTDINPVLPTGYVYSHSKTSCMIGLSYRCDNPSLALMSSLSLTSPVLLGWELVPFSFLVDWFLPIGNALQSFSTFEGLAFQKGYKTYFTRRSVVQRLNDTRNQNPIAGVQLGLRETVTGGNDWTGVQVNRTVLTDFPTPKLPRLKNPYSPVHAANAVALLVKALTSYH